MPKPVSTRDFATIEARRQTVAAMYLQGQYQSAIADEVGVTQQTVSNDLKAIREEWKASRVRDFDTWTEEQLAKIDRMEAELWEAWFASKGSHTVTTEKSGSNGNGAYDEHVEKTEERVGDMAIMGRIGDCIDRRCKLLGLNKEREPDGGTTNNTYILYGMGAKPQHVAEERKSIPVDGTVLPPGTKLDEV